MLRKGSPSLAEYMAAGGAAIYTPIYTRLAPPSEWHVVWEEEIPGDLFGGLTPEARGELSTQPFSYPGYGTWPGPNQLQSYQEENSATGLTFQAVPLLGLQPDWIGREGRLSVLRRHIYAPTAWIEEARRVSELVQKEREEAAQARVRANQQGRN